MSYSRKPTKSGPRHLRVAPVQTVFTGSIKGNLDKIERAAAKAAAAGAHAAPFPECAATGCAYEFGRSVCLG